MITVCLLNWKREENLSHIIYSLISQTIKPKIFLWNNSPNPFYSKHIDWQINSSKNMYCFPRWFMASQAQTPYVMSLDDDICFTSKNTLEYLIKNIQEDRAYGLEGVYLQKNKLYGGSLPEKLPKDLNDLLKCDIVKGRLLACKTKNLCEKVPFINNIIDDDIAVSGWLAQGKSLQHRVLPCLRKMIKQLPDNDGLCSSKEHYRRRDDAVKIYFPWHK